MPQENATEKKQTEFDIRVGLKGERAEEFAELKNALGVLGDADAVRSIIHRYYLKYKESNTL